MKNLIITCSLVVFCLVVNRAVAQHSSGTIPCREETFISKITRLKEIKSLEDLPPKIRRRVVKHLQQYLGKDFYRLLNFEQGSFYKTEELESLNSMFKNPLDRPVYELYFSLKVPQSGINFFCSRITFNSKGDVVNDIEFPEKRKGINTAVFVSKEKILAAADALGYKTDDYEMAVRMEGHIVFKFTGLKEKTFSVNRPFVEISVHTGEYISGIEPLERYTR